MPKPQNVAVWWVVSGIVIWGGSGLIYWLLSQNDAPGSDSALIFLFFTLVLGISGTGVAHSILIAWWRGGGCAWLLSSVVGLVIGAIVAVAPLMLPGGGPRSTETILFGSIVGGIGFVISSIQWLVVVRAWGRELWWWAVAGGIGWAAAWVVLFGIPPLPMHVVFRPIVETGFFFSGIGAIHALVTGAAIYRIAITIQRQQAAQAKRI